MSTENGLVRWKCWYYHDGKIKNYDSEISVWNDMPTEGLQILIKYIEKEGRPIRCVLQGQDAYILTRAQWKKSPRKHTKLGTVCPEDELTIIRQQVIAEKAKEFLGGYVSEKL